MVSLSGQMVELEYKANIPSPRFLNSCVIVLDFNRFDYFKQRPYGLLFISVITNLIHYLTIFGTLL